MIEIRLLDGADAEAFHALRKEALADAPLAFGASPGDDRFADIEKIREYLQQGPEAVLFGAFEQRELIGAAGVRRDDRVKTRHKASVWGMYVQPAARQQGVASRLLKAIQQHAATLPGVAQLQLSVTSAAPAAHKLYESVGFVGWGIEPEAIRCAAGTADEHHMVLRLAGNR